MRHATALQGTRLGGALLRPLLLALLRAGKVRGGRLRHCKVQQQAVLPSICRHGCRPACEYDELLKLHQGQMAQKP